MRKATTQKRTTPSPLRASRPSRPAKAGSSKAASAPKEKHNGQNGIHRNGSKFQEQTREQLTALLQELLGELQHCESDFLVDGGVVAEGDDATESMLQQVRSGTMDHLNRRVREVSVALERLHEGGFGVCEECGQKIGRARLAANPTATRCLACQTCFELGRR